MKFAILKQKIKFENAKQFYTAKEVLDLLKDQLPYGTSVIYIGRYLASHSKEIKSSRKGVVYLCQVIND